MCERKNQYWSEHVRMRELIYFDEQDELYERYEEQQRLEKIDQEYEFMEIQKQEILEERREYLQEIEAEERFLEEEKLWED